ncbi:MAG: D-alanine--D-alanine ligase family protein [Acidobacteriota bacterium]
MKVGITYDLREDYEKLGLSAEETAELDTPETIEAIDRALRLLGFETERIGRLDSLVQLLSQGTRWDLVFNIAEGLYGFAREAQIPALLDGYRIPYTFSDPLILALTLHKGMTKRVVRDLKIPTPDFAVVENPSDTEKIELPFPVFAKPVAEGTSKGISAAGKIMSASELDSICRRLLQKYSQPVLVEAFLPGREFTAGIAGTGSTARVLGVMEVTLHGDAEPEVYSYENKAQWQDRVQYQLVSDAAAAEAAEVSLEVWRGLGCRDGGRVDLRCDAEGRVNFIEVNPLAGLNPRTSDLPIICRLSGVAYHELIEMIMVSALQRSRVGIACG